jgi:hypothetical protein
MTHSQPLRFAQSTSIGLTLTTAFISKQFGTCAASSPSAASITLRCNAACMETVAGDNGMRTSNGCLELLCDCIETDTVVIHVIQPADVASTRDPTESSMHLSPLKSATRYIEVGNCSRRCSVSCIRARVRRHLNNLQSAVSDELNHLVRISLLACVILNR